MKKPWKFTAVLGLTCLTQPVFAAAWLEPCPAASYIEPNAARVVRDEPNFRPTPANSLGCRRGVARQIDATTTIWRCQVELGEGLEFKEGQPEYGFLIQRTNAPLQELPDELMAGAFNNFDVTSVDLDQDGTRERVLAAWNGQSNGMGVHNWTVYVFDRNWNLAKRFDDVSDWGHSNVVKAPAARGGCDIAITRFESASRTSPSLVLRARVYSVQPLADTRRARGLRLDIARDRPSLQRRYTNALAAQRRTWFELGDWQWRGNIADWLNHPATSLIAARR